MNQPSQLNAYYVGIVCLAILLTTHTINNNNIVIIIATIKGSVPVFNSLVEYLN